VKAILDALKPYHDRGMVKVLRDKDSLRPGDYIMEFVSKVGEQSVDLVIVFPSDKYWTSWWCMLELRSLLKSLNRKGKSIEETVLVIAHETRKKFVAGDAAPLIAWVKQKLGLPTDGAQP